MQAEPGGELLRPHPSAFSPCVCWGQGEATRPKRLPGAFSVSLPRQSSLNVSETKIDLVALATLQVLLLTGIPRHLETPEAWPGCSRGSARLGSLKTSFLSTLGLFS